jgi:hypothetical protein
MNFEGSKFSYAQFSMIAMIEISAISCIWLWTSTNSYLNESLKFISLCQQLLWSTHQCANMKISYIDVYPFYQLWVNLKCEVICTEVYTSCKLRLLPLIAINKGCLESWDLLIESSHVQWILMNDYVHKLMTSMCSSNLVIFAKISHSESWREKLLWVKSNSDLELHKLEKIRDVYDWWMKLHSWSSNQANWRKTDLIANLNMWMTYWRTLVWKMQYQSRHI